MEDCPTSLCSQVFDSFLTSEDSASGGPIGANMICFGDQATLVDITCDLVIKDSLTSEMSLDEIPRVSKIGETFEEHIKHLTQAKKQINSERDITTLKKLVNRSVLASQLESD